MPQSAAESLLHAPPRPNTPKGERKFVGTRIPAEDKPKLVERAHDAGLTVSEYLDVLIAADLRKVS